MGGRRSQAGRSSGSYLQADRKPNGEGRTDTLGLRSPWGRAGIGATAGRAPSYSGWAFGLQHTLL